MSYTNTIKDTIIRKYQRKLVDYEELTESSDSFYLFIQK